MLAVFCVIRINAQNIIYTNVNPDRVVSFGDSFLLDINNDGYNDFRIFQYSNSLPTKYDMVGIRPKWYNQVLGDSSGIYFYPKALNWNDPINGTLSKWKADISMGMSMNYQTATTDYGNWQGGVTNKYLGLRISFYGKWYYGWARLDIPANGLSFTIKDYAYDTVAFQGLNAAQGLPSFIDEDVSQDKISVFLTGKHLIIDSRKLNLTEASYHIYNIYGQLIHMGNITSSYFSADLFVLQAGVYVVKISANGNLYCKKILIQ